MTRPKGSTARSIQLRKYVAEHYAARIAALSPNARHRYGSQMRTHILPKLGGVLLERIDAPRVQGFMGELLKTHLAPSSVASIGRLLLRTLAVADGEGFRTCRVDARRIQWPRTQGAPRESRTFTAQEVDRILAAATGWSRVLFCLLAWAGLRIGEGLGLDWCQVDWAARTLKIRQQASRGELRTLKSYTSRADLPMDQRLEQALAAYWRESGSPPTGLVFGLRGAPRHAYGVVSEHLTPLLQRLGIPHAGPHAFRHSFCRALWAAGVDAERIRRLMRHSNLNQTLKYSHVDALGLRDAIDRASNAPGTQK
jgi:integrase